MIRVRKLNWKKNRKNIKINLRVVLTSTLKMISRIAPQTLLMVGTCFEGAIHTAGAPAVPLACVHRVQSRSNNFTQRSVYKYSVSVLTSSIKIKSRTFNFKNILLHQNISAASFIKSATIVPFYKISKTSADFITSAI